MPLFAQSPSPETILMIVFAVVAMLMAVCSLVVFAQIFSPWMQAFLSGVPVSVLELVGMRLRKTDAKAVVRFLIMARQAGVEISSREMESAYLAGVDLEKVTLAMIQANRQNQEVAFQELVDADLEGRLAEKLNGRDIL